MDGLGSQVGRLVKVSSCGLGDRAGPFVAAPMGKAQPAAEGAEVMSRLWVAALVRRLRLNQWAKGPSGALLDGPLVLSGGDAVAARMRWPVVAGWSTPRWVGCWL